MKLRFWPARVLCVLLVAGCDPEVIVGYAPGDAAAGGAAPEVTWPSGAHPGNELQAYLDFGTWRGRPIDVVQAYPDRNDWDGLVSLGWPLDTFTEFEGIVVLSQPLYPIGQGNNQDCAAGAYDAEWARLGTYLVEHDRADAIIRLGWGFTDPTHHWSADADPADWIACFRNVVTAIRSTDPEVLIDWTVDVHTWPVRTLQDPLDAYPGDAYVDIVGADIYDQFPPTHDEAEWDAKCNGVNGLCRLIDFAREHGKRIGAGEWGVASCGGDPGGDNPFFIDKVFETFAANTDIMAYEAYFDDQAADVCSSIKDGGSNPLAAARYRELYRVE